MVTPDTAAVIATLSDLEGWTRREMELYAHPNGAAVLQKLTCEADALSVALTALRQGQALQAENARLVAALDEAMCPTCDQTIRRGHAPDCPATRTEGGTDA